MSCGYRAAVCLGALIHLALDLRKRRSQLVLRCHEVSGGQALLSERGARCVERCSLAAKFGRHLPSGIERLVVFGNQLAFFSSGLARRRLRLFVFNLEPRHFAAQGLNGGLQLAVGNAVLVDVARTLGVFLLKLTQCYARLIQQARRRVE